MGEFLHKYNTDNVHSRAIIVGFVNLLNSKVFFENVLSDTSIDTVYVPFFYNMGGDERFLQDYFLEWNDCINPRHADGNYDVIPRGIVTMTSKTIDTAKMTHRFVRGNYVKEVNGQLQTYNAYLNSIPITMNFEVDVEVDSNLDAFKIEQAIMETFYKVQVFSVNFRGLRIPCQAGFSEDYTVDKTFEFTYQANAKIGVKFSVALETYYPVFDSTTERSNSNRVSGFNQQEVSSERFVTPRFSVNAPLSNEKFFSGGTLPITWANSGPIQRVNLYYRLVGSTGWIKIANNITNNGAYDWQIPFFDINGNVIGGDIISNGSGFTPSPLTEIELKIEDANEETTFGYLLNTISFTGDVDNTLAAPANQYITNVNPTVATLMQYGNLVGLTLSGAGIQTGSSISLVDPILNRIVINNVVTGQHIGGAIEVQPTIGKIEIQ